MTEPVLIATDGAHIRYLDEPDPAKYGAAESSPILRLVHALARSRVLGFYCPTAPSLIMSREYAKACEAAIVATIVPLDVAPAPPIGFFRGAPVYIDEGSNCVVVDYAKPAVIA